MHIHILSHTTGAAINNMGTHLAKVTLTCGLEERGMVLSIFPLLDDQLYLLSHSCL